MIPYWGLHRDVTDHEFQQLIGLLKPWGVTVYVYHRRDNMRHLETRSKKGLYMGPGPETSMDRVYLRDGGSGAVKQFTLGEQVPTSDEPFMEALKGFDLFDSIQAAHPDPTGDAVAVRGDNIPWDCGEYPAPDKGHNDISQTLHKYYVQLWSPRCKSPPPQLDSAVLICRRRSRPTPDGVRDIFNYVTDRAHAEVFGGPPLWGSGVKGGLLQQVRPCAYQVL